MSANSGDNEPLIDVLEDIRRWVRIIGIQETRPLLEELLSAESEEREKELRIIYHLSDGTNSTRDIAKHVSIGKDSVNARQKQWARVGLLEKDYSTAPYERIISLEEAGIEVPDIPEPEDEEPQSQEEVEGDGVAEEQDTTGEEDKTLTDY